jgi:hypothetical protein
VDADGNIPLHYAIAPTTHFHKTLPAGQWETRTAVANLLLSVDLRVSEAYLRRNDCVYQSGDATGSCTPLYRALQTLPDDFDVPSNAVAYVSVLHGACSDQVDIGNASDGDKPLALLYRRFTRQFDLREKFFPGDNSRPEVLNHRRHYKTAAGNTWKIIELLLLRPETRDAQDASGPRQLVHRAAQIETPPDLLRYIVKTNAKDLTQPDSAGNLPLHYAAKSKAHFPAFYTKYVVDEMLCKFPEAAAEEDAGGNIPLTLAVISGKQWIGGGIKSLYDAHPESLKQIQIDEHKSLKVMDGVNQHAQHDAIMLVQQANVDISEVIASMWAHEEDAGVQMLGCVAISRMVGNTDNDDGVLRISLSAVPAVVNSMKKHPNEVIVQEKACHALKLMASSDGKREVSFVASGAVAAIVGALQAHVYGIFAKPGDNYVAVLDDDKQQLLLKQFVDFQLKESVTSNAATDLEDDNLTQAAVAVDCEDDILTQASVTMHLDDDILTQASISMHLEDDNLTQAAVKDLIADAVAKATKPMQGKLDRITEQLLSEKTKNSMATT